MFVIVVTKRYLSFRCIRAALYLFLRLVSRHSPEVYAFEKGLVIFFGLVLSLIVVVIVGIAEDGV